MTTPEWIGFAWFAAWGVIAAAYGGKRVIADAWADFETGAEVES